MPWAIHVRETAYKLLFCIVNKLVPNSLQNSKTIDQTLRSRVTKMKTISFYF